MNSLEMRADWRRMGTVMWRELAVTEIDIPNVLNVLPNVKQSLRGTVWLSYDAEADTLYMNCKKPSNATDNEVTHDDVIIRYDDSDVRER